MAQRSESLMKANRQVWWSTVCLIALGPGLLLAATDNPCEKQSTESSCAAESSWVEGNDTTVTVEIAEQSYVGQWRFFFSENRDLRIELSERNGEEVRKGQILLISGRVMVTKGLELKSGYEIDVLDIAALNLQLVMQLLQRVYPSGPDSLAGSYEAEKSDIETGIHVATTSASGTYGPPWRVKSQLNRIEDNVIEYDLEFAVGGGEGNGKDSELHLSGRWKRDKAGRSIDNETEIKGWKVYYLGPYQREIDGGTIFDYGAQPQDVEFETIGELRKEIARH